MEQEERERLEEVRNNAITDRAIRDLTNVCRLIEKAPLPELSFISVEWLHEGYAYFELNSPYWDDSRGVQHELAAIHLAVLWLDHAFDAWEQLLQYLEELDWKYPSGDKEEGEKIDWEGMSFYIDVGGDIFHRDGSVTTDSVTNLLYACPMTGVEKKRLCNRMANILLRIQQNCIFNYSGWIPELIHSCTGATDLPKEAVKLCWEMWVKELDIAKLKT